MALVVPFVVSGKPASRTNKPHYNLKNAPALFEKYIKDHNRHYKDAADKRAHYEAFCDSLRNINKLNSNPQQNAVFDINEFSDYTREELTYLFGLATP